MQCHYNSTEWCVLPFIFFVQKNLQLPVQVPVGFLTRPVAGYEAHYDRGHDEHSNDPEDDFYHISVPCIRPSTMLIAIAEMNTPASMYTKSM